MNNNLDKFNPLKAEVVSLVENCKNTVISLPDGKTGYDLMKENKKSLQKKRTEMVAFFKSERSSAIDYQKAVISFEKEILAIIEPVETELSEKISKIEEEEARAKRVELLPERKEKLLAINCKMSDEALLDMDEKAFATFFLAKKDEYLTEQENKIRAEQEERERKIRDEQEKIEAEKRKLAEEARINEAKKQVEEEARKKAIEDAKLAKLKAEQEKREAVEAEKRKAEIEKQKIIDEQKRKDQERIDEENRRKEAEEARLKAEKEESERLEKRRKYQNFLTKNGCNDAGDTELINSDGKQGFIVSRAGNKFTLYKKIASITI